MENVQNMQIVESKMLVILHCAPCSLVHTLKITELRNHNKIFSFILQYFFHFHKARGRERTRNTSIFFACEHRHKFIYLTTDTRTVAKTIVLRKFRIFFSFYFYAPKQCPTFFSWLLFSMHWIYLPHFTQLYSKKKISTPFSFPKMTVEKLFCENMNNLV